MMDINFYIKSIESFIILSVMWYERLTKCYLLHTGSSKFRELGKTCQTFINFEPLEFYWTYFLALQTTIPKFSPIRLISLDHEPKRRWCAMSLNHGLWCLFCVKWALLGFRRDFPKIYDNVDVVQVANEIKQCGVKNSSSTNPTKTKLST